MVPALSRRLLLTSAGFGALTGGLVSRQSRAAETSRLELIAERRVIEVNRKPAQVFGLRQPSGESGLTLAPDQRFAVSVANRSGEDTILHWHGQTPPPEQDGVTDTGYASPIPVAGNQSYDFAPRPGTHWMHSHHGLQEQALMAAPLIVRTAEDLRMDAQEVTVLLHDFSFRSPAEVFATVTKGMAMAHGASHAGHAMPMQDLNDFEYDAYLANDRTLADPLVVRTERAGRVRLRLINGATGTAFWIDLGTLSGQVIAVDGNAVVPVSGRMFPMAQGQRLDILLTLPASGAFPILALREGERQRTGFILATPGAAITRLADLASAKAAAVDLSLEQKLVAATPLAIRPADVSHRVVLGGTMMPYSWVIDDRVWDNRRGLGVAKGQRVAVEMVNRSPMAHPMHLHGHHFQVTAINGKSVSGAIRDTVLVPVNGAVTVVFDADNPGRWLFHCHNLFHMARGMMTELAYG